MDDMVCLECGAKVGQSAMRGWVHTEQVPRMSKEHDAIPVHKEDWEKVKHVEAISGPLNAAREWSEKMRDRMLREEMQGVKWDDTVRHAVVLLAALEEAEAELLSDRMKERESARPWLAVACTCRERRSPDAPVRDHQA